MGMRFTVVFLIFLTAGCQPEHPPAHRMAPGHAGRGGASVAVHADSSGADAWIRVDYDVPARAYFAFADSVAEACRNRGMPVDEYLLVHANPWIMDTLRSQDYYNMAARGKIVKQPLSLVVLHAGDSLMVPDSLHRERIRRILRCSRIDVNIPAFRLQVISCGDTLLNAPVRVGRNKRAFLAVVGREKWLRTPIGQGHIVRVARNPSYVNPRTGREYTGTRRDDGVWTAMPMIPWLEPEIDGRRQGSLIHPTTNRQTLGRAYSNGCVGTREDDAWTIYYHAPAGTPVRFRYDTLEVHGQDTLRYPNIYNIRPGSQQPDFRLSQ